MNENELELSQHEQAMQLHRRIITSGSLAAQNLWDMANALKEMRDGKLYKEFGFANFEAYCEEKVGMKRHMAYKYISLLELKNVESIQHFGVTKLSLLASLSEEKQAEISEKVDLEGVSVRELKEEINRLKGENLKAEHEREKLTAKLDAEAAKAEETRKKLIEENDINEGLRQELEESDKRLIESKDEYIKLADEKIKLESKYRKAAANADEIRIELRQTEKELKRAETENAALISENKELRSRPVDVAVEDHSEEYEKKLAAAIEEERRKSSERAAEIENDLRSEMDKLRESYEQRLSEAAAANKPQAQDKDKEQFKIYLVTAHDAIKRLIAAAEDHEEPVYSDKVRQLLISSIKLLEGNHA